MTPSLRARLLAWVMLPLAGAVAFDGWLSHRNANETASVVQDRLLLGSARIVAEQLRFEEGAFQQVIPPAALELFESNDGDRIYYRVTTGAGQTMSGYSELPLPSANLQTEIPYFFDASVRDEPVRTVAFRQLVPTDTGLQSATVEIAQTLKGHEALTTRLWLHAMTQQLVILALVAVLIFFGMRQGLQPLLRLRRTVLARRPGTLQPLEAEDLPAELTPLVDAINEHVRRLDQYTVAQRTFIQNAAHQLRTPLTVLNTQVSYALRSTEAAGRGESLVAIRKTVRQSVRLLNQLLMLSAAEANDARNASEGAIALDAVVKQALESLAGQAQAKGIDLGFEMNGSHPIVFGNSVALREIATNLVDNAIRYTHAHGVVTVRIEVLPQAIALVVEDNGPGIAVEHRQRVFERFYRVDDGDSGGCGLGLPIVREFASRMGAQVALRTGNLGKGLTAEVIFARTQHLASDPPVRHHFISGANPAAGVRQLSATRPPLSRSRSFRNARRMV